MKILNEFPPQWPVIAKAFPDAEKSKQVLITIGDTIYNPFNAVLREDLIIHEEVHSKQQAAMANTDTWIQEYCYNKDFRFDVELEAYKVQLKFIRKTYGRHQYREYLRFYAKSLSGAIYGNICSYDYALEQLRDLT